MTSIWKIQANVSGPHSGFYFANPKDNALFRKFRAEPIGASWQAVPVELKVEGEKLVSDFLMTPSTLIGCRKRVIEVLNPLVHPHVEFLRVVHATEDFYFMNVTRVIDCLNHETSVFNRYKSGDIRGIPKYGFKPECVSGEHIFHIPERLRAWTYVSATFIDLVNEHSLTGLWYEKIWDSSN